VRDPWARKAGKMVNIGERGILERKRWVCGKGEERGEIQSGKTRVGGLLYSG
jgi:hypothetical protein